MKIAGIETVIFDDYPNLVYVRVHTDEGIVGLGETFLGAEAVSAWVHETAAPYLIGHDPLRIELHWQQLRGFVGQSSSGAENRGRSAIDIALWDLLGQSCGKTVHELLGGAVRDQVRLYNTCAGYRYVREVPHAGRATDKNWDLPSEDEAQTGPYEDLRSFMTDAGELARSLLAEGLTGMKMWPFDRLLASSDGHWLTAKDIDASLKPFHQVREAVGDQIEVMVDLHTNWDVAPALRIAEALRQFAPSWVEDPVRPDDVSALVDFRNRSGLPTTTGETLGTRWSFRDLVAAHATDYLMFDPVWTGGISEARRIAALAEAYHIPITVHDCNGPVQFTTGVHLSAAIPNATVQEFVRAYYYGWYSEIVTVLPAVAQGYATPTSAPGLGTTLRPDMLGGARCRRRVSGKLPVNP